MFRLKSAANFILSARCSYHSMVGEAFSYIVQTHLQRMWKEAGRSKASESLFPPPISAALGDGLHDHVLLDPHASGQKVLIFRGLRVRMGMSCGFDSGDVQANQTTTRTQYFGVQAAMARAISDAAQACAASK